MAGHDWLTSKWPLAGVPSRLVLVPRSLLWAPWWEDKSRSLSSQLLLSRVSNELFERDERVKWTHLSIAREQMQFLLPLA